MLIFAFLVFAALVLHSSSNVCNIPVVVYYGPSAINYRVTVNNMTTSGRLVSGGAEDMDYDRFSRRLFSYVSGNVYSIEQDGSDLRDIAAAGNVERFTVDGRNNIIYYINDLTDTVYKFNMTNSVETDLGIRAKGIDMDSVNNYLVIVNTGSGSNIERYNVETEMLDVIKSGGDFPQDVSVDADNGVVYWVDVIDDGSTFKVMRTSYAGETKDLNITYPDTIEIALDELYLYVLVVSNETIYKYKKSTWEQMGSIVVPSGTSGIEVAFDEDECCIGTFCHEQSTCANSLGNFTCICNSGYSGNGTLCEDIDECEEVKCHASATCVNNPGSFVCNCNPGFIGDGVSRCSDNCQIPYLLFSTSSGTFFYNTEESTSSPFMFNNRANALMSFDGMNKRLYFHTANDKITSYNLDGSDLIFEITIVNHNVEFFSVDGRNNLIYYHDSLQDRIFVYNITSGQSASVGALSGVSGMKDMEMDIPNGYLYIAKASYPTIIRYNPSDQSITPFTSTTGSAQSISVDEYDNVIYWANYEGNSHRVMRTLLNGETIDLNITYSGEIDVTSDVFNIYVLDKGDNRVDQYLKTSLEKQKNITYNGTIEDLIIAYDEDECCVGTFCHVNSTCSDSLGVFNCSCNDGFVGNGADCKDIDECTLGSENCHDNATCTNTVGSYTCQCKDGFTGNGVDCEDIIDCNHSPNSYPCHRISLCSDTIGSYICWCPAGYNGDGYNNCSDTDECLLGTHNCASVASCQNIRGSYICQCPNGYFGDGTQCVDINECVPGTDICHDNARCDNTIGSYNCTCNPGYSGNGRVCNNINECLANPCDTNASCYDSDGSSMCICNSGFTGDGFACTDINECDNNPCHANATCGNTLGSYDCVCKTGFSGGGHNFCNDDDECTLGTDNCHVNASCQNKPGSFSCVCLPGFVGNGVSCQYDKECARTICHQHAICIDTIGSFRCECNEGFTGDGILSCQDVINCIPTSFVWPCHQRATCVDEPVGSFTCTCRAGYTGDGFTCNDLDECTHGLHNCDTAKSECVNTLGSFRCQCKDGYILIGGTCQDFDECGATNPCNVSISVCVNLEGTHRCVCKDGFSQDNSDQECYDINECNVPDDNNCHANANCINTFGGFGCVCKPGFSGDGIDCLDIDECRLNPCHVNADCSNDEGSYTCICKAGYTGDANNSCTDIDECPDGCVAEIATCTNAPGSFSCQCIQGYQGDGHTACSDINECVDSNICLRGTCTNTNGSFSCTCNEGYMKQGNACIDIDECAEHSELCHINGTCSNSEGSYVCQCKSGFTGNGKVCTDIDECAEHSELCHINGTCSNSEGSYVCQCKSGFTGNGKVCTDIMECRANNPCHADATCNEELGSFTCVCKPGFTGDGLNCANIDECNQTGICHANAVCQDLHGTHHCNCKSGFIGDGKTCTAFTDIEMDVEYNGYAGDMFEITCNVTGPSLPSFEWRKNNTILSLSTRVKIENNDQVSKLSVRKAVKSDSGDYYCIASKGEDTITSNLSVEVKVIPIVEVSPLYVAATEGEPVTLMCGDEENLEIMWYNSKQSGSVGQSRELDLSNIKLPGGDLRYAAEYWCVAKNSDGSGRSQNVAVHILSPDFDEFCFEDNDSGYTWEKTPVDVSVIEYCPTKKGTVTRFCNSKGGPPVWGDVSFLNCRSPVVIDLVDEISRLVEGFDSENISGILEKTKQVSEVDVLYVRDIQDIVQEVLENTKQKTTTQNDRQQFIRSSSNIVSQKRKNVWMNIPSRNNLAKQVISGTDLNAENYISENAEIGKVVSYSTPNINVSGIRLLTVKPTKFLAEGISLLDTGGEGVIIPGVVINELRQATVVKYNSIKDILSEEELKESVDNTIRSTESLTIRSTIVSFITKPGFNESVSKPFKIILQNDQTGFEDPRRTCAFIEPDLNGSKWSSEGCTLNKSESSEKDVTCDCDHNTAFAILMDVSGVQLTESQRKILETISTIGCSISLVGITLTVLLHICFWKQLKSPRAKVLVSLCVAIGFTDIFAILEGVARDNPNFCKAVAALLHFFVLSAFGWMLCEGILLYILLVKVFQGVRGKHWKIFNFIGWGIPLLIVVVSLGATQGEGYGTDSSCWLSVKNNVIWAFVGPALLIILANTFVFVMMLRTMMNSHNIKQRDNIGKVRVGVKAAVVIFPILGLTWVFGLMTFNKETLFFRYLFAVFNSAQGMLIFLFHCAFNKQIRDVVSSSSSSSSTFSTVLGKSSTPHSKNSTSSPNKRLGSDINQKMVEKNTRLQAERSKSESAGHGGYNNLNVSVDEEAKEDDVHVMSTVQGNKERNNHSSSNRFVRREISFGRDSNNVESLA